MRAEDSNKLCVILGAGASHGVATEGNEVFDLPNQPPLAKQLFNLRENPYRHILAHYPGAEFLSSYLGPTIVKEPTGMEVELRTLAQSLNPRINKAFAQIPMYLQHLIAHTTTNYVSRPGAYDQLLIQIFNRHDPDVMFIVMNYDLLLERSLEQFAGFKFERPEDYFTHEIRVLKPHGSVNWWAVLSGTRQEYSRDNITWERVRSGMENDFVIRSPIYPIGSSIPDVWQMHLETGDDAYAKYGQQRALFPLITAPMASKTVSEFVCPVEHREAAEQFLNTCANFLIVGSSGFDTDLHEFLGSAIHSPGAMVHLVCPGNHEETQEIKGRFLKGVSAFNSAEANGQFEVHRQLFTEYLKDFKVDSLMQG